MQKSFRVTNITNNLIAEVKFLFDVKTIIFKKLTELFIRIHPVSLNLLALLVVSLELEEEIKMHLIENKMT